MNIKEIVSEVAKIYKTAQEQELFPVLPAGQVFRIYASGEIHYQLFLRIMDQQKDLPYITTLPEGTYSCRQLDLNRSVDLHPIFMEQLGDSEEITLIIDNVILDKYSFGSRPSELQELLEQA